MNYIERYQVWCKTAPLCEGDLKKLKELSNDEEAIKSRFADELQFGTGGIRGIMGIGTNRMNIFTVRRTAQGLATWLTGSGLPLRCAIGYDSRHNSRRFAEICAVALAEAGVHVYKQPSTSASHSGKLAANECVLVFAIRGDWAFVKRLNGASGFMRLSDLNSIM